MRNLSLLVVFISIIASGASTDPTIEAVPKSGEMKIESKSSQSTDKSLIKTEKTIVDKNCRMVNGKMECARKDKRIKRKTID